MVAWVNQVLASDGSAGTLVDHFALARRPVEDRAYGVLTMFVLGQVGHEMSIGTGALMLRRMELINRARCDGATWSKMTSRSRSLSGPSSPRATDPNSTMRRGATAPTTSPTAAGNH
jgi:hypothetical protein